MNQALGTLHSELDSRIDAIGWGLFFVMTGIVLLVPSMPDGTWLAATGAIVVGLAALRAHLGLPVSAFWTGLGLGFVALGGASLAGVALPWFATLMFVCGLALVAEAIVARVRRA